jgi:hypothetical protein
LGKDFPEINIRRLRWDIHAQVNQWLHLPNWLTIDYFTDESPPPRLGFDQSTTTSFIERTSNGGQVDTKRFRDRPLSWQPVTPRNPPGADVSFQRLDYAEVFHPRVFDQSRLPHLALSNCTAY